MCRLLYKWNSLALMLTGILLVALPNAYADESNSLKIEMDQKVLYCSAQITVTEDTFSLAMNDGIAVTTEWRIQIGKIRKYWLNEDIADITVTRRAQPDLLTRSWLLTDTSSGISRRVYQIKEAIRFLSGLEHFPVLDRSLLKTDAAYKASVSIRIYSGEINTAWWVNVWEPASAILQQDFFLP
ncbi:MAG: DUF4390 domain-containing protein [Mariprofundus sp.]